jgi:hypothetical protein
MSDFILEILEPVANTIEIETSILDTVTDNVTIEYQYNNTIDIVNTEKILASDLPYGYSISNTVGDLPYTRVSGLIDFVSANSSISVRVKNDSGSAINKGQALYITGYNVTDSLPTVDKYRANNSFSEQRFIGLASSYISNGSSGSALSAGILSEINTTGSISNISIGDESWSNGDILYVSPYDAGKLTKIKPQRNVILVGYVLNSNINGTLLLRCFINPRFDQLNGINISNPLNSNLLKYDEYNSYWSNSDDIDGGIV